MIKQLTLLCTFAIFMLTFGGAVAPLQAHCQNEGFPHAPPHPHCRGDTTDDRLYDVTITGLDEFGSIIFYGEGDSWTANTKQVGFNHPNPEGPNGFLNLGFFREHFGDIGNKCFPDDPTPLNSVILQKAKRGTAKALIWFWGYTHEDGNDMQVLYHFEFNGVFEKAKDWPPESDNTLILFDWELHLGNEGNAIKAISCLDSGDADDDTDFNGIEILVELAP